METTPRRQKLLVAIWLLVIASLLMSAVSLMNSRRRDAEELNDLGKRVEQLENDFSKRIITTVGTHKLYGGTLTLDVFEEKGGLNYRLTRLGNQGQVKAEGVGPKEPFINTGADWFALAESADIVWIFNGEDVLNCVEFAEGVMRTTDSVVVPEIVKRAPKAVRDRLPKSFQEKFKEK